jgi:hypothetical protein
MDFAGAAARFREIAEHCEEGLARDCAKAGAKEYLAALFVTTPVLSGDLRRTEKVNFVSGGGSFAVANVGPDIVYDRFRNDGGTITSHGPWPLRNRATGAVFGHSVTQAGSHYMERAVDESEGPMRASMQTILDEYLTL